MAPKAHGMVAFSLRCFLLLILAVLLSDFRGELFVGGYRILKSGELYPNGTYFKPYDVGFVGSFGDPANYQRERVNEGAFQTATQELLFEGPSPRQACPGMVGPFSDGNYYCTAKEYGYCDRRSGACFCNVGYQGIDCSECHASHFFIGNLCYPKKLCPSNCNGAGECNFYNGTCNCLPHRSGAACEIKLCSRFSTLCDACTADECLFCSPGYYLDGTAKVCSSCYDFDPRCAGCTKELGCTVCADPLLTSVRRSGYRSNDPRLPIEEDTRELSITLPFGTKSPESFAEAEYFAPISSLGYELKDRATSCIQGLNNDDSWTCTKKNATHRVCGHYGVFKFEYPNYIVPEKQKYIRLTVSRSGGGLGYVNITYYIKHFTTNDSDLSATAPYTTTQRLSFTPGVVERSFQIAIQDDNIVESDETFQIVLETPEGGGSVGPQFRANVTILDDDLNLLSPKLSRVLAPPGGVVGIASVPFTVTVQAKIANNAANMTVGGQNFLSATENYMNAWASNVQRHQLRVINTVLDSGNGRYKIISSDLTNQGSYQMRVWHAFPGGLKGDYYYDGFFENLAVSRIDKNVNFTWGTGRLIPRGCDYISIRWTGVILPDVTGTYYFRIDADDHARLWIDGELLLDHWHETYALLEPSRAVYLTAGVFAEVVMEYREVRGEAHARLMWSNNRTIAPYVIPTANLYSLWELGGSPVNITIRSAQTSAITTECQGDGLYRGVSLQKSTFSVCPRDSFRNFRNDDDLLYLSSEYFSSTLTYQSTSGGGIYNGAGAEIIYPTMVYNNQTFCFDAWYVPQLAGLYRLDVTFKSSVDAVPQPVAGSPFTVNVAPGKTFGPLSKVLGLPNPLYAEAGLCYNFSVQSRDMSQNLRLVGGDMYTVYSYRVDYNHLILDQVPVPQGPTTRVPTTPGKPTPYPTVTPSALPTFAPTTFSYNTITRTSPFVRSPVPPEAGLLVDVIRYGVVYDMGGGNYTARICPVIAGWHELHVLFNAIGVSNQPIRVLDRAASRTDPYMGGNTYSGQYVDLSPYSLIVNNGAPNPFTSTADGPGLQSAIVGIPQTILVTVRDSWDNVFKQQTYPCVVSAKLDRSPLGSNITVFNFQNGSYQVKFIAQKSGINLISIFVNGRHIKDSPFTVNFTDGQASGIYSYALGPGLITGAAYVTSYFEVFAFDIKGNRKTSNTDTFTYQVTGGPHPLSGTLQPCPLPPVPNHPACSPDDLYAGHYWGQFVPIDTGYNSLYIYQIPPGWSGPGTGTPVPLPNTPYSIYIWPGHASAENAIVTGDIYDTIAGQDSYVDIQLRDFYKNNLVTGGQMMELVMMGVGVEWGTIQPWGTTPGLPNAYHYRGFYAGFPNYYGTWLDLKDGSFIATYNVPKAGMYVMRCSVAEPGLNATFFNTTTFGYLVNADYNDPSYASTELGRPVNSGSSISWTGDWGRRPGAMGDISEGTYYQMYHTLAEDNINMNLSAVVAGRSVGYDQETMTPFPMSQKYRFREEYWSARYVGLITAPFAEEYTFTIIMDGSSQVALRIGGLGNTLNDTEPGTLVINSTFSPSFGQYNFTDTLAREFVLEFVHYSGTATILQLYWQSPSTPYAIVPPSAFSHWRNISHFNVTVHPASLSPDHSTAYGDALTNAVAGVVKSFVVYGRDRFGNLRQVGGDVPSAVAVGRNGVQFRGDVTDYGNSTYLIEYYPTMAGQYLLYVTIGCCPVHPDVGIDSELEMNANLFISNSPFVLTVSPVAPNPTRSISVGDGCLGGVAGELITFNTLLRDLHNNPTTTTTPFHNNVTIVVKFTSVPSDTGSGKVTLYNNQSHHTINQDFFVRVNTVLNDGDGNATTTYNITRAGVYDMTVTMSINGSAPAQINGSPYRIVIVPAPAYAANTVCRGVGLRHATPGRQYSFEVQLFDRFNNAHIVGGEKLYVRLIGSGGFHASRVITPVGTDMRNGKYIFTYTPTYSGPHELVVRLLNNSVSTTGGLGLTGAYFGGGDAGGVAGIGGDSEFVATAVTGTSLPAELNMVPVVTRIDRQVYFSFPKGYVIPTYDYEKAHADTWTPTTGNTLAFSSGYIRWSGYLVSPRTDIFTFAVHTKHLNATVYIDSGLVYDSVTGITNSVALTTNAAYQIVVEAWINALSSAAPYEAAFIELVWSTPVIQPPALINRYYLYDSANEIAYSPFPVNVNATLANITSLH